METVFRFAVTRPPEATQPGARASIDRDSTLQNELAVARSGQTPRTAMKTLAVNFASTPDFVQDIGSLHWASQLRSFREYLQNRPGDDAGAVRAKIVEIFGMGAEALAQNADFINDDRRVTDTLVAVKIASAAAPRSLGDLVDVVRIFAGVLDLASPGTPSGGATTPPPTWAVGTPYVIGDRVVYSGTTYECRQSHTSQSDWTPDITPALWLRKADVEAPPWRARVLLARSLTLPSRIFPLPPDTATAPPPPDDEIDATRVRIDQLTAAIDEFLAFDIAAFLEDGVPTSTPPEPIAPTATTVAAVGDDSPSAPPSTLRRPDAFALHTADEGTLSPATRALLTQRRMTATTVPMDRVVNALARDLDAAARKLSRLEATPRAPVPVSPVSIAATGTALASVPATFGAIRSVGVSDLLVVKQKLKRYEGQEVAHIENILKGESKKREHKRAVSTEEIRITEVERISEEERELESTDRFEMTREASEVIKEDASLSAGLTVSGSYGPTVDFEANVQGSMQSSRERATTQATTYSRDVTDRTATRVSERIREERSLKIVTSVEETNEHVLDNRNGTGHVRGVYQWINKIYEAQVYNYGRRALFDFTIPEPAAFCIHAMRARYGAATALTEPKDFRLTPMMINETNYHGFVLDWEATGVAPPPEPYIMVSKVFKGGPDSSDTSTRGTFVEGAEVIVPDGYQAVYASVTRHFNWLRNDACIDVTVGNQVHRFGDDGNWIWSTSLGGEAASLPLAVKTFKTVVYSVTFEIKCQRTPRAMEKWRQETHSALLQAYQQKRAAYEEQLNALRTQAGVEIQGRNPLVNRAVERRELKKGCISILTAQHFDLFGAVEEGSYGIPQMNLSEALVEGPYIRFFEQAFEWENVTYHFYPYFWGRRSQWVDRFKFNDIDPLFEEFLRAGAARVVVPVRHGFELALDHFLQTGEPWLGGELPPVTSELYVPIVQELREHLGAPGNELPVGEPWEVTVPTSLVLLRTEDDLPAWDGAEE